MDWKCSKRSQAKLKTNELGVSDRGEHIPQVKRKARGGARAYRRLLPKGTTNKATIKGTRHWGRKKGKYRTQKGGGLKPNERTKGSKSCEA